MEVFAAAAGIAEVGILGAVVVGIAVVFGEGRTAVVVVLAVLDIALLAGVEGMAGEVGQVLNTVALTDCPQESLGSQDFQAHMTAVGSLVLELGV